MSFLSSSLSSPSSEHRRALESLVRYARRNSPYYARALAHVPARGWSLHDLPVLDAQRFWRVDGPLAQWEALTGDIDDAYVLRSGGSTGNSKFSLCSRPEWTRICRTYGETVATRLLPGDRVANLFFSGNLYASYLFIHTALSYVPFPICLFPFSGSTPVQDLVEALAEHAVNVLAGVPAHLLQVAGYLQAHGMVLPDVTTVLYGGDTLFADQQARLEEVMPNARFASIGYASVEVGALGASTPDCQHGEHRTMDGEVILEILDEDSGEPIDASGRTGLLVATSLVRRLMPLIRCPSGDLAQWCEAPGAARKFILCGRSRSSHQIRIGYGFLMPDEIDRCLSRVLGAIPAWQLVLTRRDGIDSILLRIALTASKRLAGDSPQHALQAAQENALLADRLVRELLEAHPVIADLIGLRQAAWLVEWCMPGTMQINERTGKLRRVVDLRAAEEGAR